MCLCYFRKRLSVYKSISFLSHVVAQAEKRSRYIVLTAVIYWLTVPTEIQFFLWKAAIYIKLLARNYSFQSVNLLHRTVCVLNLSVSQLPNITLTLIGLLIIIAFFTWPQSICKHFWNFIFFITPPPKKRAWYSVKYIIFPYPVSTKAMNRYCHIVGFSLYFAYLFYKPNYFTGKKIVKNFTINYLKYK